MKVVVEVTYGAGEFADQQCVERRLQTKVTFSHWSGSFDSARNTSEGLSHEEMV